jgi:hypothetical protein
MQRSMMPHAIALCALATLPFVATAAEMSAEQLAKLAQNPVGNLISRVSK